MKKKVIALVLAGLMAMSMAACGGSSTPAEKPAEEKTEEAAEGGEEAAETAEPDMTIGFITLHDENSTYDKNFIDAAKAACEAKGVNYEIKSNIAEDSTCYETAADMADKGYKLVFADSFGHEDFMIQAAEEFPEVEFCHATGTKAHTAGIANFHNAFATIYEGRYLAGVAAGLKLNEMIAAGTITEDQAVMGYVGAYTYAEVISGYTSFFLGARSVCPSVTMKVKFTGSWYDESLEKEAANTLINQGCVLLSQHADSFGAPTACETAGVPDVSYNGSTLSVAPNTYIVSSRINWQPYFEYLIDCLRNGEAIDTDWTGTIATGSVELLELNENVAAEGTAARLEEVKAGLEDGSIRVFDTATFTVDGAVVDSYMADVDSDEAYTPDTEVIADGAFQESVFRSAPSFDLQIDGIELLDTAF